MGRTSFTQLTPAQQRAFGNGVGPHWMPEWARRQITQTASWFFKDASWRHHDFGYFIGGDRWDRARCDWKFFIAMLRDAASQGPAWPTPRQLFWVFAIPPALLLSLLFFLAVRLGGQLGSFVYRDRYASLDEVVAALGTPTQSTMPESAHVTSGDIGRDRQS